MKITAEFNNVDEIKEFAKLFGEESDKPDSKKKATKKAEAPKEELKKEEQPKSEAPKEELKKEEQPESEEPKEEQTTEEEPKNEEQSYTKTDVQNACKVKIKEGKAGEVKEIIKKHGANKVSELKEEDFTSVIAEVEVL